MNNMPWQPRTRQKQGDKTEKEVVTKKGGRVHPRSGAGSIKDDGSTDDAILEVKDANLVHTISGRDLAALFKRATRKGKRAEYIIYFQGSDVTLTGIITKGKG